MGDRPMSGCKSVSCMHCEGERIVRRWGEWFIWLSFVRGDARLVRVQLDPPGPVLS